jgi:type IV secretory pathway VirB2 component (pilin)
MSYPKTILTYHLPSEAEVDKSLLESHGITVNLLNAHTTRNELGSPFHIRLQVPAEQVDEAVAIIRQFNPQRFGSAENVKQIERELIRTLLGAVAWVCAAIAVVYVLTPEGGPEPRWASALTSGFGLGILAYAAFAFLRRKKT